MSTRILIRRDTAAAWASVNPVLAAGEFGLDRTEQRAKLGDGVTPWLELPWLVEVDSGDIEAAVASYLDANPSPALAEHITNPRPHPEAESGKDFAAWFNALTV